MGRTNEKMYGSYSDADLNDWEKFPMNASVLTSSAFGAWLLRRDERRDKAIPKADYENRLKADMVAMLTEIQLEIKEQFNDRPFSYNHHQRTEFYRDVDQIIQQKIDKLKENTDGNKND